MRKQHLFKMLDFLSHGHHITVVWKFYEIVSKFKTRPFCSRSDHSITLLPYSTRSFVISLSNTLPPSLFVVGHEHIMHFSFTYFRF